MSLELVPAGKEGLRVSLKNTICKSNRSWFLADRICIQSKRMSDKSDNQHVILIASLLYFIISTVSFGHKKLLDSLLKAFPKTMQMQGDINHPIISPSVSHSCPAVLMRTSSGCTTTPLPVTSRMTFSVVQL